MPYNNRYVKLIFLIVILTPGFFIPDSALAQRQPEWLHAHLNGTLKMKGHYYGAGFAEYKGNRPDYETLRLSKDRALDELCYQLSVSIKSQFEDHLTHKGDYETQQIASSLFISTRNVLSGIQEKKKWTDTRNRSHWVLLIIEKSKADQQVEEQKFINEVVDRLEHKQDEILEGMQKMASVMSTNMLAYSERLQQMESLLKTVETKIEASGDQVKSEYTTLRYQIERLEASKKAYEEKLAASERKQAQQLDTLIDQNRELKALLGKLSQKIQDDYFLSLADDDIRHKKAVTDLHVTIKPDKGQGAEYYNGEKVRFKVKPTRGCYVKVLYISSNNGGTGKAEKLSTVLFPNQHDRDNWVSAGETKIIGRLGELEINPPFGKDVITVIASETQFTDIDALVASGKGGYHSEVTYNTRGALEMRDRGIQVAHPQSGAAVGTAEPKGQLVPVATDTCFIVSRPR